MVIEVRAVLVCEGWGSPRRRQNFLEWWKVILPLRLWMNWENTFIRVI